MAWQLSKNVAMSNSKLILILGFFALAITVAPGLARAEHGIGVGVQTMLNSGGPVGASITYDTGQFHIDGIFGLYDINGGDTEIDLGGRFFYLVHEKGVSDLSIGGGLGIVNLNDTDLHIEGSAKIRVWLVSNVSFSTTLGIGFVITGNDAADNEFELSGLLNGAIGITYHFE